MTDRELSVDRTRCIGAGQCVIRAEEHFGLDDEGYVFLDSPLRSMAELAEDDLVRDAVRGCPSGALSWRDARATSGTSHD
jgi:ferredoxin